jgi:hypothetical protein
MSEPKIFDQLKSDWEQDCLHWHGKILIGKFAHWCPDFDDLPIDETMEMEWQICTCEQEDKAE